MFEVPLEFIYFSPTQGDFFAVDRGKNRYRFFVPEMREGSLDQDALLAIVNDRGWKWMKGTYDRSFSALAQDASGLEVEDLNDIEKVLAERLANRSQEFEAFGMKFPIAQINTWGTLILLGVQLYFYLYLKQLSGKLRADDPGWDVPWICMGQSLSSRTVFVCTAIILPYLAMCLLGFRAWLRLTAPYRQADSWRLSVGLGGWDWFAWAGICIYLLAIISSLLLGLLSWRFRPVLLNGN